MDLIGGYDSCDEENESLDQSSRMPRQSEATPGATQFHTSVAGPPPPRLGMSPQIDARGKKRRWAHTEGLRPSVVYVQVQLDKTASFVCEAYVRAVSEACGLSHGDFHLASIEDLPPHLSLSRTVLLREADIDGFRESLRKRVCDEKVFSASLEGAQVFVNEDESRSFVGLLVTEGAEHLRRVLRHVDDVAVLYKQARFYDVSVASCFAVTWSASGRCSDDSLHVSLMSNQSFGVCSLRSFMRLWPGLQETSLHAASTRILEGGVVQMYQTQCVHAGVVKQPLQLMAHRPLTQIPRYSFLRKMHHASFVFRVQRELARNATWACRRQTCRKRRFPSPPRKFVCGWQVPSIASLCALSKIMLLHCRSCYYGSCSSSRLSATGTAAIAIRICTAASAGTQGKT